MKISTSKIYISIIFIFFILLYYSDISKEFISTFYSQKIFTSLNYPLRYFTNIFPFSLGDILYFLVPVLIIYNFFLFIKRKSYKSVREIFSYLSSIIFKILLIFFVFITLWGWNYNKKNVYQELNFTKSDYEDKEIENLVSILVEKVNYYKKLSLENSLTKKEIDRNLDFPFEKMIDKYPFIVDMPIKIKPSIFSYLMAYMGVNGYYNPFTSEAQINKNIPISIYPFVACHEISHQLGIAPEEDANFIGFLACLNSDIPLFRYSGYLQMYLYAHNDLKKRNREKAKIALEKLDPNVIKDIEELREYYKKYDSLLNYFSNIFYDNYLKKVNRQSKGIHSYNYVVNLLVEYYREDI